MNTTAAIVGMNPLTQERSARWLAAFLLGCALVSPCTTPALATSEANWQPTSPPVSPTLAAMQTYRKAGQRWIEINLTSQRLIAWEGKKPVRAVIISTGKRSTPTPTGVYAIQIRYRLARMQGEDYDLPDVPYTMYYSGSYAIHGAYWHNRFGTPVSHGCVNVAVDHARWLFNWASIGTPVVVHH